MYEMNRNVVGAKTLAYFRGERDLVIEREKLVHLRKLLNESKLVDWIYGKHSHRLTKFWDVVFLLQQNSRMGLTEMSRKTRIPVSTLYDTLKHVEKFFHFTIVLKQGEQELLAPRVEYCYEFVRPAAVSKEISLSEFF